MDAHLTLSSCHLDRTQQGAGAYLVVGSEVEVVPAALCAETCLCASQDQCVLGPKGTG